MGGFVNENYPSGLTNDFAACKGNCLYFDHELSEELRTLYTQLMLERGFLAGVGLYATLAHTDEILGRYGSAIDEVFSDMAEALSDGDVKRHLKGPVAHSGFRRLV